MGVGVEAVASEVRKPASTMLPHFIPTLLSLISTTV
jgi:hypothetical protein